MGKQGGIGGNQGLVGASPQHLQVACWLTDAKIFRANHTTLFFLFLAKLLMASCMPGCSFGRLSLSHCRLFAFSLCSQRLLSLSFLSFLLGSLEREPMQQPLAHQASLFCFCLRWHHRQYVRNINGSPQHTKQNCRELACGVTFTSYNEDEPIETRSNAPIETRSNASIYLSLSI